MNVNSTKVNSMQDEYDFYKMIFRKNPHASRFKKPVTISLVEDVIAYFKNMAEDTGASYQSFMNLYLRDCAARHRKIEISRRSKP